MAYITPLVINALGGGHRQANRQTDTHTYQRANQSNLKKSGTRGLWPCAPGLKIHMFFLRLHGFEYRKFELQQAVFVMVLYFEMYSLQK